MARFWFCSFHKVWLLTVDDVLICPEGETECDRGYENSNNLSFRYWVLV